VEPNVADAGREFESLRARCKEPSKRRHELEYGNGIFIGVPKPINVNSQAFEAAAKACNISG